MQMAAMTVSDIHDLLFFNYLNLLEWFHINLSISF